MFSYTNNSYLTAYVLRSIPSLYVDLTDIFSSVEDASHSNENGIFASVLSENVLVVVWNDKENPRESRIPTTFEVRGTDQETGNSLNVSFVIVRNETLIMSSSSSSTFTHESSTRNETLASSHNNITSTTNHSSTSQRRLLSSSSESESSSSYSKDYYGDSLVHVNNIFMKDFRASRETKRVPAHTPLMINRDIMEELQNRYSEQYRKTSTNRFRSSDDMQYAFAYFHWLILSSRRIDFKIEEFFRDVVDTNRDGKLSENEVRTIAAIAAGGAPNDKEMRTTMNCLAPKNVKMKTWADDSGTTHATYEYRPHVTLKSLMNCSDLVEKIQDNAPLDFEPVVVESPENIYVFEMIDELDLDKTQRKLDQIRARRPKFVCVNDDVKDSNEQLSKMLHEFYESFFAVCVKGRDRTFVFHLNFLIFSLFQLSFFSSLHSFFSFPHRYDHSLSWKRVFVIRIYDLM